MKDNIDEKTKIIDEIMSWNESIQDEKLFGDVPIVSDVLYGFTAAISGLFALGGVLLDSIVSIAVQGIGNILDMLLIIPLSALAEQGVDFLIRKDYMDELTRDIIQGLTHTDNQENHLLSLFINISACLNTLESILEVCNVKTQQNILRQTTPMYPNPEQLLKLMFLHPENKRTYEELLQNYGYNEDNTNRMYHSYMNPININMLQTMYYREIKTKEECKEILLQNGYDNLKAIDIIKSWEIIPSIQDLLWMTGKEVFEPDQVREYTLDSEFPFEQVEWMKKMGLSEYWQHKYWEAHWTYPSMQQVLEMLHRGYLNEDQVYNYYRVVEIPPYWRDKLIKISYRPFTRVDVRRMHLLKTISDDELKQAYKDIGYDDDKAEKMKDFTIKYNKKGNDELSKNEILSFYIDGIIFEQDVFLMLEEIGYDRNIIDLYIKKIKLKIQKEYIKEMIKVTEHLYINNMINTGEVYSRLNKVNITSEKIEVYIDKWDVSKEKTRKYPSKEDLQKYFINDIISKNEYIDVMKKLGYEIKHIQWSIDFIEKEKIK